MRIVFSLFVCIFISCTTTRVKIVDGSILSVDKITRLTSKPDTIEYMTMWNGDTITVKEFNRKWDNAVSKTTKKLKKGSNN